MSFNDVLAFAMEHYPEVVLCYFALVLIVLFLRLLCSLFKKKIKVIDTIGEKLLAILPSFICAAEDKYGAGNGSKKKAFVLDLVKEWFSDEHLELTDYYFKLAKIFIEQILKTPQKK